MSTPKPSTTVALIAVCVVFCFTLACVVAVFIAAPDGANTATLAASLLGTLAPTIAAVALLVQVKDVKATQTDQGERLERVASDTHALTNGLLDSKVRVGVSEVLRPDLLHPDVQETLNADRIVREDAHDDGGEPPTA